MEIKRKKEIYLLLKIILYVLVFLGDRGWKLIFLFFFSLKIENLVVKMICE